jgi:hypothetical protein
MSNFTEFTETAKEWLTLHLRWEVGGGVMAFVSGVAVNTFFALGLFRAAELCVALCLIILLLWVWVLKLPALARGIAVALMAAVSICVIYKLESVRTRSLREEGHKLAVALIPGNQSP